MIGATPQHNERRRCAYVLLETVVATGLLIVGIAVIGSQVQDADTSIRKMDRRIRAMALAEQHLAELDLGLIELDSVDQFQEGDFGPRHPDWGWLLTTEDTAIEDMYLLRVDVMYLMREGRYREDDFEHDDAEIVHTIYAMRATPRPINFEEEYGLTPEEFDSLCEKLDLLGIEGISCEAFDLGAAGKLPFEELIKVLGDLLPAMGIDPSDSLGMLPPNLLELLEGSGLLEEDGIQNLLGNGNENGGP